MGGGIKRCFCLTSVCLTSDAYIGPKSRTERPRKTKFGTDSDTTFRVKSQRSPGRFGWLFKSLHNVGPYGQSTPPPRASRCLSIMNIHGVRRVGYGLEVGRSVRTAGRAGA